MICDIFLTVGKIVGNILRFSASQKKGPIMASIDIIFYD